jgi:hypothetical protein
MSSNALKNVDELIEGILKGQVKREIRFFAAQGLLPVAREDLLKLQVVLTSDPDRELAAAAEREIKGNSEEVIVEWLRTTKIEPLVLDLLARIRRDEQIWAAVASHENVSDETLRTLAQHGSPLVQDIIMTNQVRLMNCLEVLEDLRVNPHVSKVVLRRVREFEEEFIEKAMELDESVVEELPEIEMLPSIEEAFDALKDLGSVIPSEDELPVPTDFDDAAIRDAVEGKGSGDTFSRLTHMTIKEKIMTALKGSREERGILIMSRARLVVRAVLASPKLSEVEIERFAASKSVSDEVIRVIASNNRWLRRYSVVLALAQNPKTPIRQAMNFLSRLNKKDLNRVARDRNINPVVAKQAWRLSQARR